MTDAERAAWIAGQEAMRERAAKACDARAEGYKAERDKIDERSDDPKQVSSRVRWNAKMYVCESNAQAIRALPLEQEPK